MQDAIAITVALVAALWLARAIGRQFLTAPCSPRSEGPPGVDGFVPLASLAEATAKKSGRPGGRPDSD